MPRRFRGFRSRQSRREVRRPRPQPPTTDRDPLDEQVADFFRTIGAVRRGERERPLDRNGSISLLKYPEGMRRTIEECRQGNPSRRRDENCSTLGERLTKPLPHVPEGPTCRDPYASKESDPSLLWADAVEKMAEVRGSTTERVARLRAIQQFILDCVQDLRELQEYLSTLVCEDDSQLKAMHRELNDLIFTMRRVLQDALSELAGTNGKEISPVDLNALRKEVRRAEQELGSATEQLNNAIDELNDANSTVPQYSACTTCLIRTHVLTFEDLSFELSKFGRTMLLRLFGGFPSVKKLLGDRAEVAKAKLDEAIEAAHEKSKAVHKARAAVRLYEETAELSKLNELINRINELIQQLSNGSSIKNSLAALAELTNPFNPRSCKGETKDPAVKIRLIEQSRALRKYYAAKFGELCILLEELNRDIENLEQRLQGIATLCSKAERMVGNTIPEDPKTAAEVEGSHPLREKLSTAKARVASSGGNLITLASSNWETPEHIWDLVPLVELFGQDVHQPVKRAMESVRLRRAELSRASDSGMDEEDILDTLRRLDEHTRVCDLRESDEALLDRLASVSPEDGRLRAALEVYRAAHDYSSVLEAEIFGLARDVLIDSPNETAEIAGETLTRIEFLERALAMLRDSSIIALQTSIIEDRLRVDEHAYKHAGATTGGYFDADTTPQMTDELLLWGSLREGRSEYSEGSLRSGDVEDPVREHYLRTVLRLVSTAPAYISVYTGLVASRQTTIPSLCFFRDLGPYGLGGSFLYVAFDFSLQRRELIWRTAYINNVHDLVLGRDALPLVKSTVGFPVPISRRIFT